MLEYEFMQRAILVGLLLSIIIPCIGVIIVLKRLSMTGDALSHISLAGVAIGLLLDINPILSAIIISIVAALLIEVIRKVFNKYSEMAIAIVMSSGIGLAGILSGYITTANFNSFLFGSIVAMTDFEYYAVIIISFIVIVTFLLFYKELMYITFNEKSAILSKVPVKIINFIFTILTALTVSIASRTIGVLIVSSLMVIPVACSMLFAKSYKTTVIYSILFALFFTLSGLIITYYTGLKPGGTIVLFGIIILMIMILVKYTIKLIYNKS